MNPRYPRLTTEEWAAYRDPWPLTTETDWAKYVIVTSGLDPDQATAGDLAAALASITEYCSPLIADSIRDLTLADIHAAAAANLAERAEESRRFEEKRKSYPRARKVIAQQRQHRGELRRRQSAHHARALRGCQAPIAVAAVPRGTRARGAGRPPAVAARRSSSRGGDGGDDGSGPGEPPPPEDADGGLTPRQQRRAS